MRLEIKKGCRNIPDKQTRLSNYSFTVLPGDGYDEVIINQSVLKRKQFENVFYSSLYAFDFKNHRNFYIGDSLPATNLASTPWIGDLDNDKKFDIIYTTVKYENAAFDLAKPLGFFIRRYSTDIKIKRPSGWGAFMGNNYNAKFE